jgi:hypothetical protein
MIDQNAKRPVILVDLKKDRIRIHKNTLRAIGIPNYVLLLVNPDERTLAVLRSDRSDPRAHHIPSAPLEIQRTYELYSRSLIKNLRDVCRDWNDSQSYRMYGEVIQNENMVRFNMSDAILVNGVES